MNKFTPDIPKIVFVLMVCLYAAAYLFLTFAVIDEPVLGTLAGNASYTPWVLKGYDAFHVGPLGIFTGVYIWYSNPLAFVALFVGWLRARKTALALSVAAYILSLQALPVHWLLSINTACPPEYSTALPCAQLHLAFGYYVWMLSLALLVIYCFLRLDLRNEQSPPKPSNK